MTSIDVSTGPAELATRVACDLLDLVSRAQSEGRTPHVVLTGGTVATAIHRELAGQAPASGVDWARVHVWWGDERFTDPASEDRNAREARADFVDQVGVTPEHVHEMPSTHAFSDVHTAAAAYAGHLAAHGPDEFDVVLLGVGPDGHVASLFPGFPQLAAAESVVGVTGSPKPPPERITLTLATLNRSRQLWLVVAGEAKAEAVAQAYAQSLRPADPARDDPERDDPERDDPERDDRLPAARVHGRERTVWYVDAAAASLLG